MSRPSADQMARPTPRQYDHYVEALIDGGQRRPRRDELHRRPGDSRLLPRSYRFGRRLIVGARLDLDHRQDPAAPRYDVEFAAGAPPMPRQNAIPFEPQGKLAQQLRAPSMPF